MFEAVTIAGSDLNAGTVAEALIYYGRVDVAVGGGLLVNLTKSFGGENIVRAVDMGALRLVYERTHHVVVSISEPYRVHNFTGVSLAGSADGKKVKSAQDELEEMFQRNFGKSQQARLLARDLSDRLHERDFREEISKQAILDVLDVKFMTQATAAWLSTMVPEYALPADFKVETAETGSGFVFVTGLDFEEINKFYHRRVPVSHSSVDPAYLLAHVLTMRKEISYAADGKSDVWLGPGESSILQARVDILANRISRSHSNINTFHDVEFEGRTFREAIDSGENTVSDLLTLLEEEETRKFKVWLASQPNDGLLIKEYDRAVFQKSGWTQRLPFKLGKICTFAGLGVVIDAALGSAGLATLVATSLSAGSDIVVGASDEFLLSKLGKGWKPNQFVEGPAKKFFEKK
jgi:hypothetical protein